MQVRKTYMVRVEDVLFEVFTEEADGLEIDNFDFKREKMVRDRDVKSLLEDEFIVHYSLGAHCPRLN